MGSEMDKIEQVFADTLTARDFQRALMLGIERVQTHLMADSAESIRVLTFRDGPDLRDAVRS